MRGTAKLDGLRKDVFSKVLLKTAVFANEEAIFSNRMESFAGLGN
jgi:hypothetical protein